MLKFLFGTKPAEAKVETARQTAERALKELNEVLAQLPEQPKIAVAPGLIEVDWPEQMPGEAKALPAPAPEEQAEASEEQTTDKAA